MNECKQCYTIFRTINTLNLHKCECYTEADEETVERDMEETKVITIDNIQPVYVDLISEMDIHAKHSEDIRKRSRDLITTAN